MKTQAEIDVRHRRLGWYTDNGWAEQLSEFPRPGAKLRFPAAGMQRHTNIIANANREPSVGETYTLKTIELFGSCAIVTLEESGETEFECSQFDNLSATRSPDSMA